MGIYTKSNKVMLDKQIIDGIKLDDLVDNPFIVDFYMAVFDKYGTFVNDKFIIDTPNELPTKVLTMLSVNPIVCHGFVVLSGSNIVDALCPVYMNSNIHPLTKHNAILVGLTGGIKEVNTVLEEGAVLPSKPHYSDAGLDVSVIGPYKRIDEFTSLYDTGVRIQPPVGYWTALIPRSSLSKSGYMVHNSVGVVDVSYRGTILVALTKVNPHATITFPFRCAQLILIPQVQAVCVQVNNLDESTRNEGGYGSSGL